MEAPGEADPPFSSSGNSWPQPVSPWGGLSTPVNLRRAFTPWQRHKTAPCVVSRVQRAPRLAGADLSHGLAFLWDIMSPPLFLPALSVYLRWVNAPSSQTRHSSFSLSRSVCRCCSPRFRRFPLRPGIVQGAWPRENTQYFLLGAENLLEPCKPRLFAAAKPSPAPPCSLDPRLGSLA